MRGISRIVNTSFWEDEKVINDFSPEDKYFYLYLITNPHTSQLGIYKLVPKTAAFELGYSKEAVMVLLDRFEAKYDMIRYNKETCEVAIKNYLRHSVVKGGKPVMDCLLKEESRVEDKSLLEYIYINNIHKDNLNITVREYIKHLGYLTNKDTNDNDNDNDNERIVHESSTNRHGKYENIISAWNSLSDVGITPIRSIGVGTKRCDCLRARIREYGEEAVIEAIDNVRNSDFLQGKGNKGWTISFDWFVLPTNFPKVLEGNYKNRDIKNDSASAYEMPTGLEKPKSKRQ